MNPFLWRGPEFLVFYGVIGAATLLVVALIRRVLESKPAGLVPNFNDPYLIAYLRGGRKSAVQTALMSLSTRNLIQVDRQAIRPMVSRASAQVQHALERELIGEMTPQVSIANMASLGHSHVAQNYEVQLQEIGLLPNDAQHRRRKRLCQVAAGGLVIIAATKIVVALITGHRNVMFLSIAAAASVPLAFAACFPRLTTAGTEAIRNLQVLMGGLKGRLSRASMTESAAQDVLMLAAVFGVLAVPPRLFPARHLLFAKASGGNGDAGAAGSSCGSGCGGSCGSGCGGCGG